MEINRNQRRRTVMKLRKALGTLNEKTIGILGISFKPNTDDIRDSASVEIMHLLMNEGAHIQAYDPQAMENAAKVLKHVKLCESPYEVAEGADALLLATEWNEFKQIDFAKIKQLLRNPLILDGRNLWDSDLLKSMGFTYKGIGRGNS
jgi:UDPglucose 6-dehydrogenase